MIHFEQIFLYTYIHVQWFSQMQKTKNKIQRTKFYLQNLDEENKMKILKDLK